MRAVPITTDTQVATSKIIILGWTVTPDGSNAASVAIYDEADSSKTAAKLCGKILTTTTASVSEHFNEPLIMGAGCYVDIGGTNATVILYVK